MRLECDLLKFSKTVHLSCIYQTYTLHTVLMNETVVDSFLVQS